MKRARVDEECVVPEVPSKRQKIVRACDVIEIFSSPPPPVVVSRRRPPIIIDLCSSSPVQAPMEIADEYDLDSEDEEEDEFYMDE